MPEYIERGALMAALCEKIVGDGDYYSGKDAMQDQIRDMVSQFPQADVAPVRHGRWIGCNGEIVDWDENNPGCPRHSCFCSICKSWLTASDEFPVIAYFCPNCGAKMDGGEEE